MLARPSLLLALLGGAACVSTPQFTSTDGPPLHEGMVLIGAATLDGGTGMTPAAPPPKEPKEKGKGKGKDDDDEETRPPSTPRPPPPAAAPAPPGAGASAGQTISNIAVPAFWIDVRETTASAYDACVTAGACTAPRCAAGGSDHPVACVTRADATAYCRWRGKRLPTSIEWTAAAGGAAARRYPWGSTAPSAAHLDACGPECAPKGMYEEADGFAGTAPVGMFPAGFSPDGVADLAGNVAEWVEADDPLARGGSFSDTDPAAVAANATRGVTDGSTAPDIGFRCATSD